MKSSAAPAPDTTPVDAPVVIVRDNKVPPKVGGHVLYVLSASDSPTNPGCYRPAVIVDFNHENLPILQVFTNGGADQLPNVHRIAGAQHDEDQKVEGTWHWPPPRQLVFGPQQIEELDAPFPDAEPDTGKRLADHVEKKGYHVSQGPPGIDPPGEKRVDPFPTEKADKK